MSKETFINTRFFKGMKINISSNGKMHNLVAVDFEAYTFGINNPNVYDTDIIWVPFNECDVVY